LPDSGPRIAAAFAVPTVAESASIAGDGGLAGVRQCGDLGEAVAQAFGWARPDGIVLLSPAAPSLRPFRDYRDRRDHFAAAMRAVAGTRVGTAAPVVKGPAVSPPP